MGAGSMVGAGAGDEAFGGGVIAGAAGGGSVAYIGGKLLISSREGWVVGSGSIMGVFAVGVMPAWVMAVEDVGSIVGVMVCCGEELPGERPLSRTFCQSVAESWGLALGWVAGALLFMPAGGGVVVELPESSGGGTAATSCWSSVPSLGAVAEFAGEFVGELFAGGRALSESAD